MDSKIRKRKDRFTLQRAEGGNSHHCCVPLCTAGGRFNKILSFHSFPKDPELRAQWLIKIRRDGFTVRTHSRVCSRHFETGEIFVSSCGKHCLQPKVVPSLFHWNNFSKKTAWPGVWERCSRVVETVAMATEDDNTEDENTDVSDTPFSGCAESAPATIPVIEDHDYTASPLIVVDRIKYETMSKEIEALRRQLESYHLTQGFGLERFATSPDDIRYYTR
uniref:THAP domain-containing protein 1 n=1 Tax=Neogobius melanostomus TaxID=47308 RepID=A0A8C6UIJ1_9GOBI